MALEMMVVSADDFSRLRAKLPAVTKEKIMEIYGVSESTWRKMRNGVPIRRETLDRIHSRYRQLS